MLERLKEFMEIKRGPLWQWNKNSFERGIYELNIVENMAQEIERKWGVGKLRLFAPVELRNKFDSQRFKLNEAMFEGDLDNLIRQCRRMKLAWEALERNAVEGGRSHHPDVWECALPDGTVLAIVRDNDDLTRANEQALKIAAGRPLVLWSLEEVAGLIAQQKAVAPLVDDFKRRYLGAIVTTLTNANAPATDAPDDPAPFDDPIPF